jgi:uncharacterized membrane protein YeaQ/YmgE (transglycosylase-associated protein family)
LFRGDTELASLRERSATGLVRDLQTSSVSSNEAARIQESVMSIILFLVFGLVVGFLARALMPGTQKMGVVATMLLGVVGSFIGGFLGALITDSRVLDFNTAGIIGSVIGALIALAVGGGAFGRGRATV